MGAWLQRDVDGRAARPIARLGESNRLCMGAPARLGPAASDDHSVKDDDTADGGIGTAERAATRGKASRGG